MKDIVALLHRAGCVAAEEEAQELTRAASSQEVELDDLLARRITGEPLAWITGTTRFCGVDIKVAPGVYVPRWQTEPMVEAAVAVLPDLGTAVDLCTGSGAIAAVLKACHPEAHVYATDIDASSIACAQVNGVRALVGDLDAPLPKELLGSVDLLIGVVPYVPEEEMHLLPRDTLTFEARAALNGGPAGLQVLRRVVELAPRWLKTGGYLFLELGGVQRDQVAALMEQRGFEVTQIISDSDGDDRAIAGVLA